MGNWVVPIVQSKVDKVQHRQVIIDFHIFIEEKCNNGSKYKS